MKLTKTIAKAIKLRNNFTLYEFVNWLANGEIRKLDDKLLDGLQYCRELFDLAMTITSGFRIAWFNKKVKGSLNSFHLEGKAADFKMDFSNWSKYALCKVFKKAGFTNVKFYYTYNRKTGAAVLIRCHVDVGKTWNGKEFCVLPNKYE